MGHCFKPCSFHHHCTSSCTLLSPTYSFPALLPDPSVGLGAVGSWQGEAAPTFSMPRAAQQAQELSNWNRLNNGFRWLEENEICPRLTENLHLTLAAHYKEKVSETQQMQGAQSEKAINSDSSPCLIFQSISALAQTLAIPLCAAARG